MIWEFYRKDIETGCRVVSICDGRCELRGRRYEMVVSMIVIESRDLMWIIYLLSTYLANSQTGRRQLGPSFSELTCTGLNIS